MIQLSTDTNYLEVQLGDKVASFRQDVWSLLRAVGVPCDAAQILNHVLKLPRFVSSDGGRWDLQSAVETLTRMHQISSKQSKLENFTKDSAIEFDQVQMISKEFVAYLDSKLSEVVDCLCEYETREVALDEIARTRDLFTSLGENRGYFVKRVGEVVTFLPRNQPLYALSCFGIVPSLMAERVHVRPPSAMFSFFPRLAGIADLPRFFPNLSISFEERRQFVDRHCELKHCPDTGRKVPVTEVVIFTGTMENADALRQEFDPRTLVIANGAGHNPIVVGKGADTAAAAYAILRVQLYNQGQDCASPSSVLVHDEVYPSLLEHLRKGLREVVIGSYREPGVTVGPITEPSDLSRIAKVLLDNREWIDPHSGGVIRFKEAIVEPTMICRPLEYGGNYTEQYAPLLFLQRYCSDQDLDSYFTHRDYAKNAMYVTFFGDSSYESALLNLKGPQGEHLHTPETIIHDTDLHAPGVERGVNPYGGFGRGASCYSINGNIVSGPTLPQREIFELLVAPSFH